MTNPPPTTPPTTPPSPPAPTKKFPLASLWELAQWVISPPIKAGLEIYKWSKRKNPEPPTE